MKFYKQKISIKRITDSGDLDKNNSTLEVQEFSKQFVNYPDLKANIYQFLFFIRNHQQIMFYISSHSNELKYQELFPNFIADNFYENILTLNYLGDEFLALIYRLLKLEISQLDNTKNKKRFLLNSNCGKILKEICNNNEIKSFFNMLLKPIVENMERQAEFEWKFNLKEIQKIIDDYKEKHNQKDINELYRPQIDIDDLRNSLSEKNIFLSDFNEVKKENEKRKKEEMEAAKKYFFDKYIPDLTKEELEKFMNNQSDIRMKQFSQRQLNRIQKDDFLFANQNIIEQMMGVDNSTEVLNLYQTYFSYIKNVIDSILHYLIENMHLIPYSIKCICKIISILIKKKFNDISEIEENAYIGKFFFELLFFEIFKVPDYKGLIDNFIISKKTKENIKTVIIIIGQLSKGNFFKSTKKSDYTPFNWYFLYTMPLLLQFIDKLKSIELPSYLEKLSSGKINENDFSYNYFIENKEEIVNYQSICFNLKNFISLFDFVYEHKKEILDVIIEKNELNNIIQSINREQILKIIHNEVTQNKINYFVTTKVIFSPNISYSYNIKENDNLIIKPSNLNAEDILLNNLFDIQKYLVIILTEYKNLEKEDFSEYCSNSIDIIKEIIQLIRIQKVKKKKSKTSIPIEWYGKVLLNLLNELPDEYKENDYSKLYEEFEKNLLDSMNNLDFGQLSEMSQKLKPVNQLIQITKENEKLLKNATINGNILKFVENYQINISFKINNEVKNKIEYLEDNEKKKEKQKNKVQKQNEVESCGTIKELIEKFPNFITYISSRNNESEYDKQFSENFTYLNKKIKGYIPYYFKNNKKKLNEEIEGINDKIMSFFMSNIYDKLFTSEIQENDHKFYQKCVSFSWIELKDLIGENNLILDNFLPISIQYINEIEIARTPKKKLNLIAKIKRVISDTYLFNTGKSIIEVDEFLPSFAFALIKAQPKKAISNLNFIKVFYDSSKEQSVTLFESTIQFIENLEYSKLKNISKEEFENKCIEASKITK